MNDEIFLDNPNDFYRDEPAGDPRYVKHVHCDGARFHVVSWSTKGKHCSAPNCILNKREQVPA